MYPADYLSGTGSRRTTSFPRRRQLAELLIYLFIFLSAAMRNTSFSNSPAFTWSSAPVQSIYLLNIACSSVPYKSFPPCTFSTLVCILFIHAHLLLLNYFNQHCVSPRSPRSDATDHNYIRSRSAICGLNGLTSRPT